MTGNYSPHILYPSHLKPWKLLDLGYVSDLVDFCLPSVHFIVNKSDGHKYVNEYNLAMVAYHHSLKALKREVLFKSLNFRGSFPFFSMFYIGDCAHMFLYLVWTCVSSWDKDFNFVCLIWLFPLSICGSWFGREESSVSHHYLFFFLSFFISNMYIWTSMHMFCLKYKFTCTIS